MYFTYLLNLNHRTFNTYQKYITPMINRFLQKIKQATLCIDMNTTVDVKTPQTLDMAAAYRVIITFTI